MASKLRRPPTTPKTVMATPKKKTGGKGAQQAVIDNFDLEVEHRTRDMRANLDNALSAFLALVDADLLKIPRAMLGMTLDELESAWAGSFGDTHMALAKKQFSRAHPERDEADVVAAAKRDPLVATLSSTNNTSKRAQSPSTPAASLGRSSKNPRTITALTPAAAKCPIRAAGKRTKPVLVLPASTSTSTLPQHHVFNPHLPRTPRAPRRNESFFSANGSPVAVDAEDDGSDEDEEEGEGAEESDASDELPDPAEMERKALQRSMSKSSSSRRKPKRAPSLLFRQAATKDEHEHERPEEQGSMVHVPLSDGRVISFDPARIEAGRIDAELAQGGLGDEEKRKVKTRVQEEVVRALTARVAEWNALKD